MLCYAAIHALYRINGDRRKAWPKTMAKTATGAFQHPDWRHQRPSKIEAGGTHESPDATKSVQEACKRCLPRHVMTNAGPVLYCVVLCYAAIHALHRIRGDTRKAWPKTMAKTANGALQHPARRHQRRPKSRLEAPTRARRQPRASMKLAKGAQDTPKSVQELPKSSPSAAKTRPRQVWEAPRPLRKRTRQAPRRVLATIVIGSLLRQGAGTFFHDLWHCARCLRSVLRPTKTVVLSHSEHFDHASAHARKNDANKALEHPQVLPKPSKILRKYKKNRQKSLKKQDGGRCTQQAEKKRKNYETEPNMAPKALPKTSSTN